jgi:hypothetical protein
VEDGTEPDFPVEFPCVPLTNLARKCAGAQDRSGLTYVMKNRWLVSSGRAGTRGETEDHGPDADGAPVTPHERSADRILRAVAPGANADQLATLPGVVTATRVGDRVELRCSNSDAVLQALIAQCPQVREIEIVSAPSGADPEDRLENQP